MNQFTQTDTFLRLRDTPDAYVAGQALKVNGAGTALEFSAPSTIANLPTPASNGMTATITDGTAGLAWGDTLTGGGPNVTVYLVWYRGGAWRVFGK